MSKEEMGERGESRGKGKNGTKEGKWYPDFWGENYPPATLVVNNGSCSTSLYISFITYSIVTTTMSTDLFELFFTKISP